MVDPKSSIATRKEIKVPKKPLASWIRLVAMISVVICARIRPLDCIGTPFSASLWRKPQRPNPLDLAIIMPSVSIYGPQARSLSHGVLGNGDRHLQAQGWFMLPAPLSRSFQQELCRGPDDRRFHNKAHNSLSNYGRAAGGWLRSRVSFGYIRHLDARAGVLQCGRAGGR